MGEQYFSKRPTSRSHPAKTAVAIRGVSLRLKTDAGVFSRRNLDRGTELLIEALQVGPCELILDLGCGYGVIGLVAARLSEGGHVILTDVNERAVALARTNRKRNAVVNAEIRKGDLYTPVAGLVFNHIVCNPPLRAGRGVVDRIIREAPAYLLDGGRLWLVAKTKLGADSIRKRMADVFGNAVVAKRGSGYKVVVSTKQQA